MKKKKEEVKEEKVQQEEVNEEKKELTEVEKLQQQIAELKKEVDVTKNAYYKAYADCENFKKRLQNEADSANKYRIQSFAINILPALDNLERALAGKDTNDPFIKGVKLTYDALLNALNQEGISEIECLNKPFDANFCNAMVQEKVEGIEPNMVVEVYQKGYILKDRLLRAALVKVSE